MGSPRKRLQKEEEPGLPQGTRGGQTEEKESAKRTKKGKPVKEKKIQSKESHRSQEGGGFSRGVHSRHGPSGMLLPSHTAGNLLPLDAKYCRVMSPL